MSSDSKPWETTSRRKNNKMRSQQPRKRPTDSVRTDRGICKFFILDKCTRGDDCQWAHTKNQCGNDDCEVYTERDLCFKCHKIERKNKQVAYEQECRKNGYRCANETTCKNYTLRGDYCSRCYSEMSQYVVGPCRNRDCTRRVQGGRGYCGYCQ